LALNLVICRAGDHSLHRNWLTPHQPKNFELWINYFGTEAMKYAEDADFYWQSGGTKYPELYQFIHEYLDIIQQYDAICLAEDDIDCDATTINKTFEIFHQYDLWLAQPSLSPDSYTSHPITLNVPNNQLRFTNFVEIMIPVFSTGALLACYPTFKESDSGWGLDFIWSKIMGNPTQKIAIIDAVTVRHTRPIGHGDLYLNLSRTREEDAENISRVWGIPLPYQMITYESVV
jgi:hypothetical protein